MSAHHSDGVGALVGAVMFSPPLLSQFTRLALAEALTPAFPDDERSLRPTTMKEYRRHVRDQITPSLGDTRLEDLRASAISGLLRDLERNGLGITSIQRVHATPRSALADAVRADLIRDNPPVDAVKPRLERPRVDPGQPDELGTSLDHASADELGPMFELIGSAGSRRGEALGLRWADVNLHDRYRTIRQRVVQFGRGGLSGSLVGETLPRSRSPPSSILSGSRHRVPTSL